MGPNLTLNIANNKRYLGFQGEGYFFDQRSHRALN